MIKTRKIEENDWKLIESMLSERYSKKETRRRMAYFQKLNQAEDCNVTVGLIDFNIVSFCVQHKSQEIEKFVTKDWKL